MKKVEDSNLKSRIQKILERDYFKKKIFPRFFHLFAQLDIDMQALEYLRNTKNAKSKEIKYLKKMFGDTECNVYKNKFVELNSIYNEYSNKIPKEIKKELKVLLGIDDKEQSIIFGFLKLLDDGCNNINDKYAENIFGFFEHCCKNNKNGIDWKNINSFHQWYRKLATYIN